MPLFEKFNDAPFQGVSEAPQTSRLPEQVESSEDAIAIIPEGAVKRPPLDYIARLNLARDWQTGSLFQQIAGQDFALVLQKEGLTLVPYVYDLATFSEQPISITSAAQVYLNTTTPTSTPNADYRVQTVADTTFIANRNVVVANQTSNTAVRPFEALIWCRQGAFAREYAITVRPDGGSPITGTFVTPDGDDPTQGEFVATDRLIAILFNEDPVGLGAPTTGMLSQDLIAAGFTYSRQGSVVYISHPTIDFTVEASDGQAGQALEVIKERVQSFGDLPERAVDGFVVRVSSSGSTDLDDAFFRFDGISGNQGLWEETIAPDTNLGVNPITLPITLVNNGGTWEFDVGSWKGRQVGDEELSPDPEFIGQRIEDITFWQSRVALVFGEGVHLSATDDPFLFYPRTLTSVLDSDAFGLTSPYEERSTFRYAVTFNRRLLIFSDTAQFEILSSGVTTPTSTEINTVAQYDSSPDIRPQAVNSRIYFGAPKGDTNSGIFEMQVDRVTDTEEADDTTLAVPRLLPADIDRVASNNANYLSIYGKSGDSRFYAHLYRYAESQRVQNGWFPMNLSEGLQLGGMFFDETKLYILAIEEVDGGNNRAHVCVMDFTPSRIDPDPASRYLTMLDYRRTEASAFASYDNISDTTSIPLLIPGSSNVRVVARAPGGLGGVRFQNTLQQIAEGTPADIVSFNDTSVTVRGDWSAMPYWVGFSYTKRIRLSRIYARDGNGNPLRSGRLSIRKIIFDVSDSGFLAIEVTAGRRQTRRQEFQGYIWGDATSLYGVAPVTTTDFNVGTRSKAEELQVDVVNDSHFPSRWTGWTWFGEYNARAGRV